MLPGPTGRGQWAALPWGLPRLSHVSTPLADGTLYLSAVINRKFTGTSMIRVSLFVVTFLTAFSKLCDCPSGKLLKT